MKYPMVIAGFLGLCAAIVSGGYAAAGGMREEDVVAQPEEIELPTQAGIAIELLPRPESVAVGLEI